MIEFKKKGKTFSTANAYLLVYYRNDLLSKINEQQKENNANSTVTNQSDLVKQDNALLETWFKKFRANKLELNESKNTERAVVNAAYTSFWLHGQSDSSSKPSNNKTKKTNNEIDRSPTCASKLPRSQMYFLSVDFLKRLLSFQNNLCSSDAASINSIQKYLCPHRKLNPLAIGKFKLVNKEGLEKIMSVFTLQLSDLGALEAGSEEATQCRKCVLNCFDYLKMKEKMKTDAKLLRNLLKVDVVVEDDLKRNEDSENSGSSCEQPEVRNLKRLKKIVESDDDVIMIEEPKSVMSIDNSNESKEFFKQQQQNGEEKTEIKQHLNNTSPQNAAKFIDNNKENNEFTNGNIYFWVGKESIKVNFLNLCLKYKTKSH